MLIIEKMKTVMGVIYSFLVEQHKQQTDSGVYTMEEPAEPKAVIIAELRADIDWISLRVLGGCGRHRIKLVGGFCKVAVVRAMSAKQIGLV